MPQIVLVSNDLMFSSRIQYAARQAGYELTIVKTIAQSSVRDPQIVVIDLATAGGDLQAVVDFARENAVATKLIAFGPHVQSERLDAAKQAGFDLVLTRGQLDRDLGQIFRG